MPELPEVETVKNGLIEKVKGKKIISCEVKYLKIVEYPQVERFIKNIANQTIEDIKRRGKFIIFELDDYLLISHLRMEGKYFIKNKEELKDKHDHIIFSLDDNQELRYNDTRKFGRMYLVEKDKISLTPISKLGLEPWDLKLDANYLQKKTNKKKAIKSLLLDQSIIAGIGNIYADEILFMSKINPCKYGKDLTHKELNAIIKNTQIVLQKAISLGGTTIHSYTSVNGITGRFQQELLVHGKKGLPCPNCHTEIEKITVNTRGTYYCPKCQK